MPCRLSVAVAALALLPWAGCSREEPPAALPPPAAAATPVQPPAGGVTVAAMPRLPSTLSGLGARRHPPRFYPRRPATEMERHLAAMAEAFAAAASPAERIRILDSLGRICHPAVIPVVTRALGDPDALVRDAGMAILEGYTSPDVLPLVDRALGDPEPAVRLTAAGILAEVADETVAPLLARALNDADPDVREEALASLEERPYSERLALCDQVLQNCPHPDVREEIVGQLQDIGDPNALDLIIEALRDKDEEVRRAADEAIFFLVSESFASYDEAHTWWARNRARYDDELFEIDP